MPMKMRTATTSGFTPRLRGLPHRYLVFDLLRCFPSSTDRQSFPGDLPMSSYGKYTYRVSDGFGLRWQGVSGSTNYQLLKR